MLKKIKGVLVGVVVTVAGSSAFAQTSDMMGQIDKKFAEVGTNLESIGIAFVLLAAIVMMYKWMKAMFF